MSSATGHMNIHCTPASRNAASFSSTASAGPKAKRARSCSTRPVDHRCQPFLEHLVGSPIINVEPHRRNPVGEVRGIASGLVEQFLDPVPALA